MDINQVSGTSPLAPKPSGKKSVKPSDDQFSQALDKALEAQKSESAEQMEEERLKLIQKRIQAGYYDRPDIIEATAEKIIHKGK